MVAIDSGEIRRAHREYLAARDRAMSGASPWSVLAAHFTADAVYIDPAWGRVEGIEAITAFFDESMAGLEGWTFPEVWTVVEGDRLVSSWWNRLPGARSDGSHYQALGISTMHYAGGGRFSYSHDLLNMAEVLELIQESGWVPGAGFNVPPQNPDRDISRPGSGGSA